MPDGGGKISQAKHRLSVYEALVTSQAGIESGQQRFWKNMKISEITAEELDRLSAEKVMGWVLGTALVYRDKDGNKIIYQQDDQGRVAYMSPYIWHPSDPATGQIWMVVNALLQIGWQTKIILLKTSYYECWVFQSEPHKYARAFGLNPCLAILKAAHEALEEKCG